MSGTDKKQPAVQTSIEDLCAEFQSCWQSSHDSVEAFLDGRDVRDLDEDRLIARLVKCEIELHRQAGEFVDGDDYRRRFPGLSGEILENLMVMPSLPASPPKSGRPPLLPRRYKVLEQIGQGGIGSVWRVEDRVMRRPLAAKVLLDKFKNNVAANARLQREALLAGSLQHPGIPPVFERGDLLTGSKFFTMKLVEGQTLDELLRRRKAAGDSRPYFLGVFRQIADAVGFAHSKGVVHRDLKPQNVMVGEFGEVQIMDWGMAKRLAEPSDARLANPNRGSENFIPSPVTKPAQHPIETNSMSIDSSIGILRRDGGLTLQGDIFGTPSYMSPEQAQGNLEQLSERSDVFSLGAMLFEILTGRRLYQEFDTDVVITAAAHCDTSSSLKYLESCDADDELVALCASCLECDSNKRPANGLQVAVALSDYLSGVEQRLKKAELETAASAARVAESRKRMRTTIVLVAVAALVAIAGLTGITWKWREANRNFRESQKQSAARDVYFSKSLDAVDQMLTRVGSEMLANVPQMSQVRRQLLTDALVFYNDLLQDSTDDPALQREFGRIQQQVGVIHGKLGDHKQAAAAFQLAARTFKELSEEFPHDIVNVLDYCGARNLYAMSIHDVGKSVDAEIVLREVIALLDQNKIQPDGNASDQVELELWLQVLADAHAFLATVLPSTLDNSAAIAALEQSREYYEQIPEDRISDAGQLSYASVLESLASYLERMNKIPRSIQLRTKAITIIEGLLVATPESPEFRNRLANIQQSLNGVLARQGKLDEAARGLEREIEGRRQLIDDFPNIPQLKKDFARGLAIHGSVLNSIGNFAKGQQSLAEATEVAQELVDQFPETVEYQRELAFVCQTRGTAYQLAGGQENVELSNAYHQKAYETGQKIVALAPNNARFEYELGMSARNWSVALLNLGTNDGRARDLLEGAIKIFSRLSTREPENTDYLYQLGFTRLNYTRLLSNTAPAEAANVLEEACQTFTNLIELQPEEPRYRLQLTRAYDQLSTLQFRLGAEDAWENSLRQANQIIEDVVAKFGREAKSVQFLTISKNRLAHCLESRGKVDEANQLFQAALALRQEFVDNDADNEKMARQLASSHANLAWNLAYWQTPPRRDLQAALQHATNATELDPEAAEHWTCRAYVRYCQGNFADVNQVLAGCEPVNEPDQMGRLALQAMTHWQLGDHAAAESALAAAKKLRESEAVRDNMNARLVELEFYRLVDEADALIQP